MIVLGLFVLSIISVAWIYFNARNSSQSLLPTPVPAIFGLNRVIPANGVGTTIVPTSAIEFEFNKQINPNTLIVKVEPLDNTNFEISDNLRSVFVRVIPTWKLNTDYTITIEVKSQEGESLPEPLTYPLRIVRQTKSNLIEKFQ